MYVDMSTMGTDILNMMALLVYNVPNKNFIFQIQFCICLNSTKQILRLE